jgi:tetratricopeptide (TPR) repeat protein
VIEAWIAFHAGDFQKATELGLKAGQEGVNVANKAQAIYANYLEENEKRKLELFEEVADRAEALQRSRPKNANAFYWQAYALGRYAQGISIAKAREGTAQAVLRRAAISLRRNTPMRYIAGPYHAEVIDKVGAMIGGLTYGAKKDVALKNYQTGLKLMPDSAIARIEYANGLVMLEGKKALKQAEELYGEAAACEPLDAMERLDVELAKSELED